jgi:hypothetical protein
MKHLDLRDANRGVLVISGRFLADYEGILSDYSNGNQLACKLLVDD